MLGAVNISSNERPPKQNGENEPFRLVQVF